MHFLFQLTLIQLILLSLFYFCCLVLVLVTLVACKAVHATGSKYASHVSNVRPVRSTCSLFTSISHTESKRTERRVLICSVIKCCGGNAKSANLHFGEKGRKNVRPNVRGAARGRLSENGIGIERPVV